MISASLNNLLNVYKTCVFATVTPEACPEAATVGYSIDEDMNIMFETNQTTRKSVNINSNNTVASVIDFEGLKTVQIEEMAETIDTQNDNSYIELRFKKVPGAKRFASKEEQSYYIVKPNWFRFTDYTNKEKPIVEIEDFS